MKNQKTILILGVVIILVLVVWGLAGSAQAAKVGIDCKIGLGNDGSVFCWSWEKNVVGEIGDVVNSVFGK